MSGRKWILGSTISVLLLAFGLMPPARATDVEQLRCEYLANPLGIDALHPRLSWIITSNQRNERQKAYQILVASSPNLLAENKADLWDSGKVLSDETTQIAYRGQALQSREACYWKVRIWDGSNRTVSSAASEWTMGLLEPADWKARWISPAAVLSNSPGRLEIRRAVYKADDGNGGADVTRALVRRVEDNRLAIVADNKTLGVDPAYNHVKHLSVSYDWDGHPLKAEVSENETLTLPRESGALPYLRKDFELGHSVRRAVLYVTALGLYQIHINGRRVGDHVFAPDWTDYRKRVRYQAYDVTGLLRSGENTMAAILANGWYSGHIGNGGFQFFGKRPELLAQLEVTYDDGSKAIVVTDSSWQSHPSAILSSDFMMGEDYDARREVAGWDQPGLDDAHWTPVEVRDNPAIQIQSQLMPPVHELLKLKPIKETEPRPKHWVYDLGQNMVGVVRLKISAPAGTEITLRHGEMLNPDGTLYTKNLRGAPSIDRYICRGNGTETWQPSFTFHGFRYVEITGPAENPGPDAVTGIVIGSDTPHAGNFECSDPLINQLESNIQWSQRGNYLSVPTDCPQRDERLGWMGDAEVFVRTATYNSDVASFFTKWLVDVDDGQSTEGAFSDVSPNTMTGKGTPAWGDAGVICPWTIYEVYGDKRILENHLPAMIRWVDYLKKYSNGLIRDGNRGGDYGDWLSVNADTPKDLIGTAYFAYSTHLVAESCAALGRSQDAAKYQKLFEDIKAAFIKRFVGADGHVEGRTQTAYLLALKFDLLPEKLRARTTQFLIDNIQARGSHLSTGFLGVSFLLPTLEQMDQTEAISRLLFQKTYPSWLFPVTHGATTIWERWDGWTPEKGFQDPGMNSFNHYSLGSCGEFFFEGIGGIRPGSAGFKTIIIDPVFVKGLAWARTDYDSIHGRIATDWKINRGKLVMDVTIPANTRATVSIPSSSPADVLENGSPVEQEQADGITFRRQERNRTIVEVGSGTYHFVSQNF